MKTSISTLLTACVAMAALCTSTAAIAAAVNQGQETVAPAADSRYPGTLTLEVDLRNVGQKIFNVHEVIPAKPGALTLLYPKWIPGEHGPTGTLDGIAGIKFTANGQRLPWHRDLKEMYALHLVVPAGVAQIELEFQMLSVVNGGAFGASVSVTDRLVDLEWNQVVFYPAGHYARDISLLPGVQLPDGWKYATSLQADNAAAAAIRFKPVTLETLIDSPLIAGINFRRIQLTAEAPTVHLNVVADRPQDLAAGESQINGQMALVKEASALFGARHYQHYDFLLTLSDHTAHFGLEHHQSSDDRLGADFFTDAQHYLAASDLMPHEYVHSWNGKFRRPKGLATPDYLEPMSGDLLWVYEGMTQYLGEMLTARAGLWTPEQYREHLALVASELNHVPGRVWRPLQDTADEAQILYNDDRTWQSWKRGTDFYDEGELLWLDVDTKLRELSQDRKSMDDFTHLFHGIRDGEVAVASYDVTDVIRTLDQVQHYDWAGYLKAILESNQAQAPLAGLGRGGWKLDYSDTENPIQQARDKSAKHLNLTDSIGMLVDDRDQPGMLLDVLWQGPAFDAGLAPGMTLIAVNGDKYSADVLKDAITAAHAPGAKPIELLVENQDVFVTCKVDYHGGLRYPHLERVAGTPDRLAELSRAHRPETPGAATQ
jgi:predicted metalloprotease with PDZ domain